MAEWFVHVTTRTSSRSVTPRGGYLPRILRRGWVNAALGSRCRRPERRASKRSLASPRLSAAYAPLHARALPIGDPMTKVTERMMSSSGASFRVHHLLALRRRLLMNCSRRTNAPTNVSMLTLSCIVSHSSRRACGLITSFGLLLVLQDDSSEKTLEKG